MYLFVTVPNILSRSFAHIINIIGSCLIFSDSEFSYSLTFFFFLQLPNLFHPKFTNLMINKLNLFRIIFQIQLYIVFPYFKTD